MLTTAKVFTNGHSQAIRLPKAFRVDVQEMWIAKNEVTGEITLTPKEDEDQRKRNLEKLFQMIADDPLSGDFLSDSTRRNGPLHNPFAEWTKQTTTGGADK